MGSLVGDAALAGLIGVFEQAFPGRLHSVYVDGSHADRSHVAASDIDVSLVFRDRFVDNSEQDAAVQLARYCASMSVDYLDIEVADDEQLAVGVYPALKLASLCVYGQDCRDAMTILPISEWTLQRMHAAYWLLVSVFERPRQVTLPLDYPDPHVPYYGYANRQVRLPNGEIVPSTRNLVRVVGWLATALIAYQVGVYVARKSDCHRAYAEHIGDEWTPLVTDLYRRVRSEWGYLIPPNREDQDALQEICERVLAFENHFLGIYRSYVVQQLTGPDEHSRERAIWMQRQIPLQDGEVMYLLISRV